MEKNTIQKSILSNIDRLAFSTERKPKKNVDNSNVLKEK